MQAILAYGLTGKKSAELASSFSADFGEIGWGYGGVSERKALGSRVSETALPENVPGLEGIHLDGVYATKVVWG